MILSDKDIKRLIREGKIIIRPFFEEALDDVTYEVHLSDEFVMIDYFETPVIDISDLSMVKTKKIKSKEIVLQPGHFVIGRTMEWIELPEDIAVIISGKTSLARLGLQVHAAALVHPRSKGYQVLELFNYNRVPIVLKKGMAIAQLIFIKASESEKEIYDWMRSYRGQKGIRLPERIPILKEE